MRVPLRRFRTTRATAMLRTARRPVVTPGIGPALVAVALFWHLAHAAAAFPPGDPAVGRLLATGDAAAERGWFLTARDHWQAAARAAAADGDAATAQQVTRRIDRLDAIEREIDATEAARSRAVDTAWADATGPAEWPVAWRVGAGQAGCGVGTESPPVAIAGGLVVWNTGRSLHAVTLADGRPRWRTADDRDTCLFPRGMVGLTAMPATDCTLTPTAPACVAGRVCGMINRGRDGQLLVCLDLSDPSEGRVAWAATAADATRLEPRSATAAAVAFDGPPAVDEELCGIVIRADDARGSLALAVFDTRDGSPRWVRRLGPSVATDGIDRARGRRSPCLAEDRIIVDTHAGRVLAFDRDGTACWTMPTPPAADPGDTSCVSPARCERGRAIVVPVDGSGIVAVDPRRGEPLWRWQAGDSPVASVLGRSAGGLVIATRTGTSGGTTLRRLEMESGRQTAAWTGGDRAARDAGQGVLIAGTVFWPVGSPGTSADRPREPSGMQVEVLDAVTLERRRPPVDCGPPSDTGDGPDARVSGPRLSVADGSLLIAGDTITCRRPAAAAERGPAADTSPR